VESLIDSQQRRIRYLRISVTPHCNLRCAYCQPDGPLPSGGPRDELSPHEIERLASVFARLGVRKIRLSGGEPTLRKDLPEIVRRLARVPGIEDLSLSTHGMFLAPLARPLADAGLGRVNFSLDTLDRERFRRLTGHDALCRVLAGLDAAREAGLTPIKLNVVPLRGINEDEIGGLIELAREHDAVLRFIELMPLEVARDLYEARHLGGDELLALLAEHGRWTEQARSLTGGPARIYARESDGLRVGIIDPLSQSFCGSCNRVRITHRGELRNCLFGRENVPLREQLRGPDWERRLEERLRRAILEKPERHRLEELDDGELYSLARVGG